MNYDELKSRDIKDLRKLAAQYGIKTHPRHKPETVAKLIVEHITAKPHGQDQMKHVAELTKEPAKINTEDEIKDAIKHLLEKPHFTITFPGDDTWIAKCRGAEESGHMSVPLRVLRSKCEGVARGAIVPRGFNDKQLNPTANSGIVMMV